MFIIVIFVNFHSNILKISCNFKDIIDVPVINSIFIIKNIFQVLTIRFIG